MLSPDDYATVIRKWREAEQQIATLTSERDHEHEQRMQNMRDAVALQAKVATLTEALRKYGQHESDCQARYKAAAECTCGFRALAAVRGEQGKCANGHTWSNQFGDDWTPDTGTPCDCGGKRWGIAAVRVEPTS